MEDLTKEEVDFIIDALNAYWNESHELLQRRDLGDIQRKNLEFQKSKSNDLMKKLGVFM